MIRKLKTYVTSLGFFDQAIAAPSMKAALEAWGADSNLFHQGVAKQSDDPDVIAATMAAPGVVLKRPIGSSGPFKVHAELPSDLAREAGPERKKAGKSAIRKKKPPKRADDKAADRKAAIAFENEQKRRERERAKEEVVLQKERKRRQAAVEKAQSALDTARRKHEVTVAEIQSEVQALEKRSEAEEERWAKEQARLEDALRRART